MQRDEDEDAWRSIIDNYGERVELDDDEAAPLAPAPAPPQPPSPPAYADVVDAVDDVDRFVAPDPPLPAAPTRDRQAAWVGLIGAPILLMILLVASVRISSLLAYALIAAFVGGFLYLTFHLPRDSDDPFDDGARL